MMRTLGDPLAGRWENDAQSSRFARRTQPFRRRAGIGKIRYKERRKEPCR
jgi:hypothetical protein